MEERKTDSIIQQTRNWVKEVVIGCGFCPFASKVFQENSIRYTVEEGAALHEHQKLILDELRYLDEHPETETTLLIFPDAYAHFSSYWTLIKQCERLLGKKNYEGVYQIASFHPLYVFGDSDAEDPANYTNRSPYPMLHLLREESLSRAIAYHPDPDSIPERNIAYAREKGIMAMQLLLEKAMRKGE